MGCKTSTGSINSASSFNRYLLVHLSPLSHAFTAAAFCRNCTAYLLSTHADRQGVDISFTLCLCVCVCMDMDFSAEDKASGVTFCLVVYRRLRQGTLLPQKPKIGRTGQRMGNAHPHVNITVEMRRRKFHARDAPIVKFKHVCNISLGVWT